MAGWSIFAVLVFIAGPDHAARLIGGLFAPGFDEVVVEIAPPANCGFNCQSIYHTEFVSNSGFFNWFLNATLLMWVLPPAIAIMIGMTLRTAAARSSGIAIATVRLSGLRDTLIRPACLVAILLIPLASLVLYGVAAADPVHVPT